MKDLTKAEEQLMQILWHIGKGYLKDIVEAYEAPKPAYTTISTVLNVLVKKEVVAFNLHGKSREYYPLLSKEGYTKHSLDSMIGRFFDHSTRHFASFFTSQKELSTEELKEIRQLIDEKIAEKNG